MRFRDLCSKEVVNALDCSCLGHVRDIEFEECTGKICAIIVPGEGKWNCFWGKENEILIPWSHILKIGPDIILVNLEDCDRKHKI